MTPPIPLILDAWRRLVARHAAPIAAIVALLTVLGLVFDLAVPADALVLTNLTFTIVTAVAQSWLTLRMLCAAPGYDARRGRLRIVALIVLGIPTTLAIIVGLLLLIVPGLYLAARWSAAAPALIGEDGTIGEAIGRSWRLTRSAGTSIAACIAVLAIPLVPSLAVALVAPDPLGPVPSLFINLLVGLHFVGQWVLGVAVYLLLPRGTADPDADPTLEKSLS